MNYKQILIVIITPLLTHCKTQKNASNTQINQTPITHKAELTSFAIASNLLKRESCTPDLQHCVWFAPTDMPINIVGHFLENAEKNIKILNYNMNVSEYVPILKHKAQTGVQVEMVSDFKLSFTSNSVWNALDHIENITRWRIPVLKGGNPQMHNKIIIIDDQLVLFGSANWTYSGLVANYENIHMSRDQDIIQKFLAEYEELKGIAVHACQLFTSNPEFCGKERQISKSFCDEDKKNAIDICKQPKGTWDQDFYDLSTLGYVKKEALQPNLKICDKFTSGHHNWGQGIVDEGNQDQFSDVAKCFKNQNFAKLVELVSKNEKFTDGSSVKSSPQKIKGKTDTEINKKNRAYFGPEDNLLPKMLNVLSTTLKNPKKSFIYISNNFITHPILAEQLLVLRQAQVRMRIFFDHGRYIDTNFSSQLKALEPLGFSFGEKTANHERNITIFKNNLTSSYGANHQKWAVIGNDDEIYVMTGSANWSVSAVTKNDENLQIFNNKELAAIYLREMLSELYVYRYFSDDHNEGWKEEVHYLTKKLPCLKALLGMEKQCIASNNQTWNIDRPLSHALLSLEHAPANPENDSIWVWYQESSSNHSQAIQLFTSKDFNNKWVTSIPITPNSSVQFKFFKTQKNFDPNKDQNGQLQNKDFSHVGNENWEPIGGNRSLQAPVYGVHTIKQHYTWGKK